MKKKLSEFSESELKAAFGSLSEEDLAELRTTAEDTEFDPGKQAALDGALRQLDPSAAIEVPPMPDSFRNKVSATVAQAVASRDASVHPAAKAEEPEASGPAPSASQGRSRPRAGSSRKRESWWSRIFQPAPLIGFAAAAAAVAVAMFVFRGSPDGGANVLAANSVTLLTPGQSTGFVEPTFTWRTDNGGAVTVIVIDERAGKTIARLDTSYSPVRFASLEKQSPLEPGSNYRVELRREDESGELLAKRDFSILPAAEAAPERDKTLEGVIEQCKDLIAAGRHADAWMLWGEITAREKQDPRMAELKALILKEIG